MKSKFKALVLINICFHLYCYPQVALYKGVASDCNNAVIVALDRGVVCSSAKPLKGFGKIQDIQTKSNLIFEAEHNSAWYMLNIKRDGVLGFEITPFDTTNDYDFLLYKYTDSLFCNSFQKNKVNPVRNNLSKSGSINGGCTGLFPTAKNNFVAKGPGETYSKSIEVKNGEKYMLVLDNVNPNGKGFSASINFIKQINLKGVITDFTGRPLKSEIILKDKKGRIIKQTYSSENGAYSFPAYLYEEENYALLIRDEAYFPESAIVNTGNLETGKDVLTINKSMKGVKLGETYELVSFMDRVFPDEVQKAPVHELSEMMKQKPKMRIQVQGHADKNECSKRGKGLPHAGRWKTDQERSDERALIIYSELSEMGIVANRMEKKGFASEKLLITNPKNGAEADSNCRVSIKMVL